MAAVVMPGHFTSFKNPEQFVLWLFAFNCQGEKMQISRGAGDGQAALKNY